MKALRTTLFSLFFSLFALNLLADGIPPSQEDVCDPLLSDLVTPGLFNLCNAYCEAKDCDDDGPLEDQSRSCQNLYWNFVDQAIGPNDPVVEPPESLCLAVETHDPGPGPGPDPNNPPSCACWADDDPDDGNNVPELMEAENLPDVGPSSTCTVDTGTELFEYDDANYQEELDGGGIWAVTFYASDGALGCFYYDSIFLPEGRFEPLDPVEVAECIDSVKWLQYFDFELMGIECAGSSDSP